jgi:hypothetical protein
MSDEQGTQQTIFTVTNRHVTVSGQPPFFDADERGAYVGYFANEHGEQAIFHYDRDSKKATLRMGDAGWEKVYEVKDGRVPELILDRSEQLWVLACWEAAMGEMVEGATEATD